MRPRYQLIFVLLMGAVLCLVVPPARAENQRLILKDGSYQPVVQYEVKGDRVRYLSAERNEWEEVPSSMVDWPATEKWQKDRAAGASQAKPLDAEESAERAIEAQKTPTVAPGIQLPLLGGAFLLDVYRSEPQLVELEPSSGEVNKNTGRNVLRSSINPLAGSKQTIELQGPHARVQSHVGDPFIYINLDQDEDTRPGFQPAKLQDRFHIVQLQPKKNNRVVGSLNFAIYGKVKQEQHLIDTTVEQVGSGPWIKVAPSAKLEAGEYALVERLANGNIYLDVWDFGVNAAAAENPGVWKTQAPNSGLKSTTE